MEYNFKITVEEFATACKVIETLGGGRARFNKISKLSILCVYILICSVALVLKNYRVLSVFGLGGAVILIVLFISMSPSALDKSRVRVVTKMLNKKSDLLDSQRIEIQKDYVIYSYGNVTIKTKYEDIAKVIVEKDIIMAFGPNEETSVVLPCSVFKVLTEREQVINLLSSEGKKVINLFNK